MSTPHRCPVCDGEGRRVRLWADATGPIAVRCEPCGGTGIVWEPEVKPGPAADPLPPGC